MIFSSDRDFTLWPPPGTELTVDLDATSLELPVVGGDDGVQRGHHAVAIRGEPGFQAPRWRAGAPVSPAS